MYINSQVIEHLEKGDNLQNFIISEIISTFVWMNSQILFLLILFNI